MYSVASGAICLSAGRGLVTTYRSRILGADWRAVNELPLTGLPSRARLSRDGTLAAATTFVFGDSAAREPWPVLHPHAGQPRRWGQQQ